MERTLKSRILSECDIKHLLSIFTVRDLALVFELKMSKVESLAMYQKEKNITLEKEFSEVSANGAWMKSKEREYYKKRIL